MLLLWQTVHMKWEPYILCKVCPFVLYICLQVSGENDAVVFIATPAKSSHTIINTGNPETLVSAATMAQAIKSGCSYPATMMCLLPPTYTRCVFSPPHTQGVSSPPHTHKVCVTTSGAVSVHSWLAHHATYFIYFQQRSQFLQ